MQVSKINNHSTQNFGSLHLNDNVGRIIRSRINNDLKKGEMLDKLIEKADKNKKVNIDLMVNPDGKTLSAELHTTSDTIKYFETKKESFFSRHFQGGIVEFLNRCVNKTEIDAEKIRLAEHVTNFDYIEKIRNALY